MALWLRSVRRRPSAALGVFLIVTVASAASVAGPILVRAAEQSGLRSALASAHPGAYDIEIDAPSDNDAFGDVERVATASASAANPTLFDPPMVYARTQNDHTWHAATKKGTFTASAASAVAGCNRSQLAAGSCPAVPGDVLVASQLHLTPGTRLSIVGRHSSFTVVGVYRPSAIPAWFTGLGREPVLTTDSTLTHIDPTPLVIARDHLRIAALKLDRLSDASASVRAVTAASLRQSVVSAPTSTLPVLVASAEADRKVAIVVGLLTVVPLVLLCWYTLALILRLIAVVRSREWALGRLRGLRLMTWLSSLFREPAALLVAGAVCGFGAGVAVAVGTVHATMAHGTPVEAWRLPVLVCFLGTVVGAALGIAFATARVARRPLATLLQQSAEPARLSRVGAAVQVLVLAATALSIVQLATADQVSIGAGDLGVLLPGLLAAALSLAAIRIAARIAQRNSARPPKSIRRLLIGRRLARNPELLGRYLVVAVAAAVMAFTVSLVVIMQRNVRIRADNEVGAARVVHVQPVAPDRLLAAVAAADPSGHNAMAVEQLTGPGDSGTSRIVAVDSARLARVSYWQPTWAGLSGEKVHQLLVPRHAPPIELRGTSLTMTVTGADFRTAYFNVDPKAAAPRPMIELVVLSDDRWVDVEVGRLTAGTATLHAALPCAKTCVLRQVGFVNGSYTLYSATATIRSLSTDRQSATTFARALRTTSDWHNNDVGAAPGFPVRALPTGTSSGLIVRFHDFQGQATPAVTPADGPADVPVIAADGTEAEPLPAFHNAVDGSGLDATHMPMTIVARARALPSSVDDGVLVDLAVISRFSDPAASHASAQVWLSASAQGSLVAALQKAGLRITRVDTTRTPTDRLLSAAPVRTVIASIATVALLALLAAVALGAGVAIDGERRRAYARVLRDGGFAARAIDRLCFAEIAVPASAAVVLGVVAGTAAVLVAGHGLPLFGDAVGPPLATAPPWIDIGALAIAAIVLVLVASAALAVGLRRAATRSRA